MAKVDKKEARLRRAQSTRHRIRELMVPRLTVHRSGQHIYAQVLAAGGSAGVDRVAFDRSGFKYHGRIQALADAAREGGLQF